MKFTSCTPNERLIIIMFNNNGLYVKNSPQLQKIGVIPSNSKDAYKYLSNLLSNLKKVSFVINDWGYWTLTDAGETYARQLIAMLDDDDVPEIEDTHQKTCNDIIRNSKHITEESLKFTARMIDKVIASKSDTFELEDCYEKIKDLEKRLNEKDNEIDNLKYDLHNANEAYKYIEAQLNEKSVLIENLRLSKRNDLEKIDKLTKRNEYLENIIKKIQANNITINKWLDNALNDGTSI
ncbi:MAG: hypothetical protein J6W16_01995 [Methanobrevibacter sp.]|nr:hypothetical protein [Methanobrevibacter sp.]